MALKPDDTVCYCFHVPLRKIENFCLLHQPQYASQISTCLSAGTGCGWCRPMLGKIHRQICGTREPWWRKNEAESDTADTADVDAETYAAGREKYLGAKRKNPTGGEK